MTGNVTDRELESGFFIFSPKHQGPKQKAIDRSGHVTVTAATPPAADGARNFSPGGQQIKLPANQNLSEYILKRTESHVTNRRQDQ